MAILAFDITTLGYILYVALGLGLVIFFHELGHFAVAKWCGVLVERFSIGFGPVIWSFKKGDTEYALSAVPFGGYVKMLGQDDVDPSQLSSEEIALDPRSYSAKSVPQRMAIISAGVIMNVITGLGFFALAFHMGIEVMPASVGTVIVGMPAWEAGIEQGDRFTRINGRDVTSFNDIMRGVALSMGDITIEGVHQDGRTFDVTLTPDRSGTRRSIGVSPTRDLVLIDPEDETILAVSPDTAAARAQPPFFAGDTIRKVQGTEIADYPRLREYLARRASETLDFEVERKGAKGDLVTLTVEPNHFRTLGLWMDVGKIAAVKKDSPADKAGLRAGDKITRIFDKAVGTDINPLRLPDYLASHSGQEVEITVIRPAKESEPEKISVRLTPLDLPGWVERPGTTNSPLSVPSVGVAFHLIPAVLKVEPGSPAAETGIQVGTRVKQIEFVLPKNADSDGMNDGKPVTIKLDENKAGQEINNWAYAFWMMQMMRTRDVRLTFNDTEGKANTLLVTPRPNAQDEWYLPTRGILLTQKTDLLKSAGAGDSVVLAMHRTRDTISDIYLTLRNLVGGFLSYKELHGPIGIANAAYQIARRGISDLLLFLGYLSINLAVLNFLPIPVLDGGHMVFLCWEAVTRKRPNERVLIAATYCGMAFVLGLMILVIYLDIVVHGMGIN